jgi:hypothetical protein
MTILRETMEIAPGWGRVATVFNRNIEERRIPS